MSPKSYFNYKGDWLTRDVIESMLENEKPIKTLEKGYKLYGECVDKYDIMILRKNGKFYFVKKDKKRLKLNVNGKHVTINL